MSLKTDILYLQKDRFELYSSTLLRVFEFMFVPEIVQDFDVKNSDLFKNLINVFISNNKIPPSDLIIVLSDNACFVKDFVNTVQAQVASTFPDESMQKEIDLFVQHVPFDEVSYVIFPLTNGVKVFVTNEGLYKDIISAFEKSDFKIEFVLPGMPFGNNLSTKTVMDTVMANFILQNVASVNHNNFLIHSSSQTQEKLIVDEDNEEVKNMPEVEDEKPERKNNKRILILVGVFIVLLVILVIVYMSSIGQPAP